MLRTILCAVDGSGHAEKAADWAGDLAARYGARLVLTYVTPRREVSPALRHMAEVEHLADDTPRASEDVRPATSLLSFQQTLGKSEAANARIHQELGERILARCKHRVANLGDIEVAIVAEDGDPADRILAVAEREKADLIVMGRRGLGDLKGLLLGSVTHKVSQLSNCPCLTVH